MKIKNHDVLKKVFIIAEIGNNHEGDLGIAKEMISAAYEGGADAVKFQTIIPKKLVSIKDIKRIEQLSKFQFSYSQFEELAEECNKYNIQFLSTPFDLESVSFLNNLVSAFKIASGDNNFIPLIKKIAQTNKPIIMSTGLAEYELIKEMITLIKNTWGGKLPGLAILHCVTSYPTPNNQANLKAIERLKELDVIAGYSDHTIGIDACPLAVALGARIIEKHFTLDNNFSDFRDHQLSASPADFKQMVTRIRIAETMLGDPSRELQECELSVKDAVRRSIAAARDLEPGTTITDYDLIWIRPGTGIKPGLESNFIGKKVSHKISAGTLLSLEDLEE